MNVARNLLYEKVCDLIKAQQKGKEGTDVFAVGEQLAEMAWLEPVACELLVRDLELPNMGLVQAAAKIKAYADSHKKGNFAYVSPAQADKILREFYGIPAREEGPAGPSAEEEAGKIDLSDFL